MHNGLHAAGGQVGISILALIIYVAGLASFTFGTMAYV